MNKKLLLPALLLCAYSLQAAVSLFPKDTEGQKLKDSARAQEIACKRYKGRMKKIEGEIQERKARVCEIKRTMDGKSEAVQNKRQKTIDRHEARIDKLNENFTVAKNKYDTYHTRLNETRSKMRERAKPLAPQNKKAKKTKPKAKAKKRRPRKVKAQNAQMMHTQT